MKNKLVPLLLVLILSLSVIGCGRSTVGQGAFFSELVKPPPQEGMVYLYQVFKEGLGNKKITIFSNDEAIVWLRMGSYYPYVVKPGIVKFWARGANKAEVTIDVKPGGVYFLRVELGFFPVLDHHPVYFQIVGQQEALEELKEQRLLLKPL